MKMSTKIWLIIAVALIVFGCLLFVGVMTNLKWNFLSLSTNKYQTNTYEISQSFSNISLNNSTTDVVFLQSNDNNCKVVCFEAQNEKHTVSVKDNTLFIEENKTKAWYENIGINFNNTQITVYLPLNQYGNINSKQSTGDIEISGNFSFNNIDISLSTGDIELENIAAEDINVSVSTGDITLENINCKSLASSGSTGEVDLENVIADEKISITRSSGCVEFEKCDAGSLDIAVNTGDVTGSLLSDKIFKTSTATGNVSVPNTNSGGECKIKTSTGNIKIRIVK